MTKYIDGFLLSVPKKKLDAYRKLAQMMAKLTKKYGALEYVEAAGEDMNPKGMGGMKFAKFPEIARAKDDETVIFSYIVYKSRSHRDEVNAKIMNDPMMKSEDMKDMEMPFNMQRMAYGGFKTIVAEGVC